MRSASGLFESCARRWTRRDVVGNTIHSSRLNFIPGPVRNDCHGELLNIGGISTNMLEDNRRFTDISQSDLVCVRRNPTVTSQNFLVYRGHWAGRDTGGVILSRSVRPSFA
eukprot:271400-Prymnesium_polylepis.1